MNSDEESFMANFRKSMDLHSEDKLALQRSRLVHIFDHSKKTLDAESACCLLENELAKLIEIPIDGSEKILEIIKEPPNLDLDSADLDEILSLGISQTSTTRHEVRELQDSFFKSHNNEQNLDNLPQFRSATEELQIQAQKGQKRKLGGLRNVHSKFIPPMLKTYSSMDSIKTTTSEPEDERLKHIDPAMVELIKSEIMANGTSITWDDIAGLEFAKTAIKEAVVWPLLRPDLFTGLRRPSKGILLFGPPGTGKTLIGKCVASQSKSTFFCISASSLTSKWVGDGEKMVRALFAVARVHQPAIIFIDEIDSLLKKRSDTEHDSCRRIKTEFLVQLDGAGTSLEERLVVIGATNRPQELDEAARRRFTRRIYIPIPDYDTRSALIRRLVQDGVHCLREADFKEIAQQTEGYSGADIKNLSSEAALGPIRSLTYNQMEEISLNDIRPLNMQDFQEALKRIRSSVAPSDLEAYTKWDLTYGSGV